MIFKYKMYLLNIIKGGNFFFRYILSHSVSTFSIIGLLVGMINILIPFGKNSGVFG